MLEFEKEDFYHEYFDINDYCIPSPSTSETRKKIQRKIEFDKYKESLTNRKKIMLWIYGKCCRFFALLKKIDEMTSGWNQSIYDSWYYFWYDFYYYWK